MAQQYRELGSSGAAQRQVPQLNKGKFVPSESTSNLANFAHFGSSAGGPGHQKKKSDVENPPKNT